MWKLKKSTSLIWIPLIRLHHYQRNFQFRFYPKLELKDGRGSWRCDFYKFQIRCIFYFQVLKRFPHSIGTSFNIEKGGTTKLIKLARMFAELDMFRNIKNTGREWLFLSRYHWSPVHDGITLPISYNYACIGIFF